MKDKSIKRSVDLCNKGGKPLSGSFLPEKAPEGYVDGGTLTNLHIPTLQKGK